MKSYNTILLLLILFVIIGCKHAKWVKSDKTESQVILQDFSNNEVYNVVKSKKIIPNEEMAISIAEVYLFKLYGKKQIVEQRPYVIRLMNDSLWAISGTLHYQTGGTFEMVINSKNGEVIEIAHGK